MPHHVTLSSCLPNLLFSICTAMRAHHASVILTHRRGLRFTPSRLATVSISQRGTRYHEGVGVNIRRFEMVPGAEGGQVATAIGVPIWAAFRGNPCPADATLVIHSCQLMEGADSIIGLMVRRRWGEQPFGSAELESVDRIWRWARFVELPHDGHDPQRATVPNALADGLERSIPRVQRFGRGVPRIERRQTLHRRRRGC